MSIVRTTQKGFVRSVITAIFVIMVLPPFMPARGVAAANGEVEMSGATEQIYLLVGRSTIIRTDRPIVRVSLSTPEIADAMVTAPRELLVHGKTPGTISLLVWNDFGRITAYEVAVRRDLSALEGQIRKQFPEEPITVASNGKDVVLSGVVSTKYVSDRAKLLAVGYVDKPENVVSLLRQQENIAPNQVLLNVRFAEVNRTALQELGINVFGGPTGADGWMGHSSTQQFTMPVYDADKKYWKSADFLNLDVFNVKEQIGATIKALKGKGLFESLAEPNLITLDGREASFLAGGEYPYPVVQGGGSTQSVTIVFKEYGIRLKFTPTLTGGDFIHLKVAPEVSSLDFANAVVLEGFRVPALNTRRTDTEVELHDGQTFAISGLLDRNMNETLRRVPGIGDIPILGYLFRSQAYQKNRTELVVMITPHILRRDSPGVTPNLPGLSEPFLPAPNKTIPMPAPTYGPTSGPQQPMSPTRSVVSNAPAAPAASVPPANSTATSANTWANSPAAPVPAPPAYEPATAGAAPAASTLPWTNANERKATDKQIKDLAKRQALLAEQQRRQDAVAKRAEAQQSKQAMVQSRAAAKIEAERAQKQAVIDAERQRREQKISEKRAAEQAIVDRKRWLEQQEKAADAKAAADKIAKEQDKTRKEQDRLAKEQADREAELARLVSQYRKLTEGQSAQPAQSAEPTK
jgi:pilus assembly protein CpaC